MQLQSIHIYPIKSTRRLALSEAVVEPRGLAGDRRWLLVDTDGVFLSQRSHPRMALIRTELHGGGLAVTAPQMPPLVVPRPTNGAARAPVRVWNDEVAALPAAPAANAWFSRFLDLQCRLVFMDETAQRPFELETAGLVSFADMTPVLIATQASLDALNARLDEPLPMNRFRPNLVVAGTEAFEEDRWPRVRIGEVVFDVIRPAGRCVVTTIDQDTAAQGKEPLRTLATFRKQGSEVMFGIRCAAAAPGVVRVGDAVHAEA